MQTRYLKFLENWVRRSVLELHKGPNGEELFYGEGSHCHWAMQTCCNSFAAFGTVAKDLDADFAKIGLSRKELTEISLKMLRHILNSHEVGDGVCSDGESWGLTWISPLGLERMMHAVESLWNDMTEADHAKLRALLIAECDYQMSQDVRAGIETNNVPESNIWKGAILLRAALYYPDLPQVDAYRESATRYILNGISVPSDAESSDIFEGRPLSEWHVGPNYTESYSLNHHGYLNVGYMVICLSNLAMIHFSHKRRGVASPDGLRFHVKELWNLVKKCTFSDGRLLRIGGDTRVRYCYCQDYCVPAWLMIYDMLGDTDIPQLEDGWLKVLEMETTHNNDDSFLSHRLADMHSSSAFYFYRLEADRAVALSMAATWRRMFNEWPKSALKSFPFEGEWHDDFHGSSFIRSPKRVAAWTWFSAERPSGLCGPVDASDMFEWQYNLSCDVRAQYSKQTGEIISHHEDDFTGGFVTCGSSRIFGQSPIGEGETDGLAVALQKIAFAVLPDDETVVCFQYAEMLTDKYLKGFSSVNLKIPNDVFNGFERCYTYSGKSNILTGGPQAREDVITLNSRWLSIDGRLCVHLIYGADSLQLYRPASRQIHPSLRSLFCDEIRANLKHEVGFHQKGEVLINTGFLLRINGDGQTYQRHTPPRCLPCDYPQCHAAVVAGANGKQYVIAANFADSAQSITFEFAHDVGSMKNLADDRRLKKSPKSLSISADTAIVLEVD